MPAKAGIQCLYVDVRHPCLFPRRPTARVTFLSGKVTQAIGAGTTVSPTSGWLDCPALLAGRAPARTRTSLCSNNRAFSARPAAMLGVTRRRRTHSDTAIHGLLCGLSASAWFPRQQLAKLVLLRRIQRAFGLFADQRVEALLHGLPSELAQRVGEFLAQGFGFAGKLGHRQFLQGVRFRAA